MTGMAGRTTSRGKDGKLLHCRAGGRRQAAYVWSAMDKERARPHGSRHVHGVGVDSRRHLRRLTQDRSVDKFVRTG